MKKFDTGADAKKYAEETIHKYDSEVVEVAGKKTWLSATSIPLEERFREPIEIAVQDFFDEMGFDNDDAVAYIGAQVSGILMEKIEENSPLKILCAYQSY